MYYLREVCTIGLLIKHGLKDEQVCGNGGDVYRLRGMSTVFLRIKPVFIGRLRRRSSVLIEWDQYSLFLQ